MSTRYIEAIYGTLWAALLSIIVLASSIIIQFTFEFMLVKSGVGQSSTTEYLVSAIDITGAVGSGATFILLTFLQVAKLVQDVKKEVLKNE